VKSLKNFLDKKVEEFNQPSFIIRDPICIPHSFSKRQDIEIAGFFAAIFAWGNRTTIINKSKALMQLMHNAPHDFCLHHTDNDLKKLLGFKHRTFTATDLLYFIEFFKTHYTKYDTLEKAFFEAEYSHPTINVENALVSFHKYFFSLPDVPGRTKKHISSPNKNSSCKRLNMFLRWMVRHDNNGVDFGLWKSVSPSDLIIPIDLHVARVAKRFDLLSRPQVDWQAAKELTEKLKAFDRNDPVKYDFALFSLGIDEKF
jgi:uncharacterized protein (TIGR02757 family)